MGLTFRPFPFFLKPEIHSFRPLFSLPHVKIKELIYSSSGQILSLGRKCVGLFGGITLTGSLCEYAEDFIIDNYISALKNRML
jgi:hypothetical protein